MCNASIHSCKARGNDNGRPTTQLGRLSLANKSWKARYYITDLFSREAVFKLLTWVVFSPLREAKGCRTTEILCCIWSPYVSVLNFKHVLPIIVQSRKKNPPSIFVCLNWGEKRIRGEGKVYELNKFCEPQLPGEKIHKASKPVAFCHALLQYGEVWLNL